MVGEQRTGDATSWIVLHQPRNPTATVRLDGDAFTPPASVRAIAGGLLVTKNAVKQQLGGLYPEFDVLEGGDRRLRLADEALIHGAVSLADLQTQREDS